jgi:uncharacterized protein
MRPEALEALSGSDLIIHAGDVGKPAILDALKRIARTVAVQGNVDPKDSGLPVSALVKAGQARIYVLHDLKQLKATPAPDEAQIVVSGHSHQPSQVRGEGVLYVNPGSAGPRRFRLPVTLAKLDLAKRPWSAVFIELKA